MIEIAYKVLRRDITNKTLVSSNNDLPLEILATYKIGEKTFPKVGKLFVFAQCQVAESWRCTRANQSCEEIELWQVYADNLKPIDAAILLGRSNSKAIEIAQIETFWKYRKFPLAPRLMKMGDVPAFSFTCDSVELIKRIQ